MKFIIIIKNNYLNNYKIRFIMNKILFNLIKLLFRIINYIIA